MLFRGVCVRPALTLDHAAAIVVWLGWGAVITTLLSHTSQAGVVLGRYSLGLGLLLVAGLAGFLLLGALLIGFWVHWPAGLRRHLQTWPSGVLPAYLLAGAAALAWVRQLGLIWYGVAAQPGLSLGLVAIYAGVGLLLYLAIPTSGDQTAPRRALAALLYVVPVSLFAAAAGVRPDLGRGLLMLPALLLVALGTLVLSSPTGLAALRHGLTGLRAEWQRRWLVIGAALIAGYIALIYSPGLSHAPLADDELRLLWSVYAPRAFAAWAAAHPYHVPLVRPLFTLQAAALYGLFGVNGGAYFVVQVLTLTLSCWLVFYLVQRISHRGLVALLAALLVASHTYISDLVTGWSFDTGAFTGILVLVGVWLVVRWRARLQAYVALGALLLLAPISRENGLALPGAVAFYSVIAGLRRLWPRRHLAGLLALTVACVVGYFAWRSVVFPNWFQQTSTVHEDTGMFFHWYTSAARQLLPLAERLQLNVYTAGANLVTAWVPVIGPYGLVWDGPFNALVIMPLCLLALALVLAASQRLHQPAPSAVRGRSPHSLIGLAAMAGLAQLSFSLAAQPLWFLSPVFDWTTIELALHAALSLGLVIALAGGLRWSRISLSVALLSVGLILANSLVNFPYFRYRAQYLGFLGWVLLFAVVVQGLRGRPWQTYLRRALLIAGFTLVLVNGVRLYTSLPRPYLLPENFTYTGLLCDPSYPPELLAQISDRYHLDQQRLQACRTAPP